VMNLLYGTCGERLGVLRDWRRRCAAVATFGLVVTSALARADVDPQQVEQALNLVPDTQRGTGLYKSCAKCHGTRGQGSDDGDVPLLAGQHRDYLVTQLLRMRAGARPDLGKSVPKYHSASVPALKTLQSIVDTAGYVASLPPEPGAQQGPGHDLDIGHRVFVDRCVECHGPDALGQSDMLVPRLRGQNYSYIREQIARLGDGHRMPRGSPVSEVLGMLTPEESDAVADYLSRLPAVPTN